jgi:hypothetical protein
MTQRVRRHRSKTTTLIARACLTRLDQVRRGSRCNEIANGKRHTVAIMSGSLTVVRQALIRRARFSAAAGDTKRSTNVLEVARSNNKDTFRRMIVF